MTMNLEISLADALGNTATTENGAITNKTTLSKCLDFFWQAPTNKLSKLEFCRMYIKAFNEDPATAIQLAFWLRDPRQGSGMREKGRWVLQQLATAISKTEGTRVAAFAGMIVKYGRWDDLLCLLDTVHARVIATLWVHEVRAGNGLAAKWAPRENSKNKIYAKRIMRLTGMRPKAYRQLIAVKSNTVEQQMCANNWQEINFEHVPSQAMRKLQKAFRRHCPEHFQGYNKAVERGEAKITAKTLWPHQILAPYIEANFSFSRWYGGVNRELTPTDKNLWANLPNWVKNNSALVVCDTSGSMNNTYGDMTVKALHVALSLAIYTSERLEGVWANKFISFSREAKFVQMETDKSLARNISEIPSIIENTNLESVFRLILDTARRYNIPQDGMPQQIIVISDMQFDAAGKNKRTNFEHARKKFAKKGYQLPNVVWWNLNGTFNSTAPVTYSDTGTALISGFSPSVLKGLLGGKLDPMSTMRSVIEGYPSQI